MKYHSHVFISQTHQNLNRFSRLILKINFHIVIKMNMSDILI